MGTEHTLKPPNVAVFASAFSPHVGGVEELSHRLATELRLRGSDTVVLTNRYPANLPRTEAIKGVPVHRERFRFPERRARDLAGFAVGTLAARRGVRDAITSHGCELVHVQCVSTNGYYAMRVARSLRLPLVVSMQGELTMDADQSFQRSSVRRREWRALLDRADVVTGCSQQVVDEAVEEFGPGLAEKARVVRNGVDLRAVRMTSPERRERAYVLGIGRFVRQKGFDVLIDAFSRITAEFPDLDLVLAGDGPERANLEQQARGQRVAFLGSVPARRAFSLHRGASAFVLSSRHEPQGIVVIEAMAAGTPVLATRVGGVPETVANGVNGLLVPGDDAAALADGLRQLLTDPSGTASRVVQASTDVESYAWSSITDQYEECYADAKAKR